MKPLNRLRRILRRPSAETDLADEIQAHIALEAQQRMDRGVPTKLAWSGARRDFGNELLVREVARDEWGWRWIETLFGDLRYALRTLLREPGFAAILIFTLAGGIGSATAIFSVVYAALLQPLPFHQPDRLVAIWMSGAESGPTRMFVSLTNYLDWRADNRVFEDIGITRPIANLNLTGAGTPERLEGARISETVLPVLGVRPLIGRNITEKERQTDAPVALLSYGLWQRRFAGDPSVLNRKILLNGTPYEVIGIMPRGFEYPGKHEIWVPLFFSPPELQSRIGYSYLAVARLKPGVTVEQARNDMAGLSARLAKQYPDVYAKQAFLVDKLHDSISGSIRTPLLAVFAAVGALVAIGSANLAGLLLTRGAVRTREFSIRTALGAGRGRIAAQMIVEVLVPAILGAGFGILLARIMLFGLIPLLPPDMPGLSGVALNLPVLGFAICVGLVTATLTVLVPATHAGRADVARNLKEDSRTLTTRSALRNLLVIGQIGITLALLITSGLLLRSLHQLNQVSSGFDSEGALTMHIAIPRTRYATDTKVADYCGRLVDAVRSIPGVQAAGMVNRLPLTGVAQTISTEIAGTDRRDDQAPSIDSRSVTPDYFRAMGIPILSGRDFSEADTEESRPVAIIDAQLARRFFSGQNPIGSRLRINIRGSIGPWTEIVGVAGHIRNDSLETDARPQVYWSYRQRTQDRMAMVIRTLGNPSSFTSAVVQRIRSVDPEQPVYDVRTMKQWRDRSLRQRHLTTGLISVFAAASFLLALLGVYGVLSYVTTTRTREFGIRIALGATESSVQGLVLKQAFRLGGWGLLIGVIPSIALVMLIRSLLFDVTTTDNFVLIGTVALVFCTTLIAGIIPARRAMHTDPLTSLRQE